MNCKKAVLIFVFIQVGFLHAKSSIELSVQKCRSGEAYYYLNEFKLFRNDTLMGTINLEHQCDYKIKKLSAGKYRIEYQSMFRKTENVTLIIDGKNDYQTTLCFDYLDPQKEPYKPCIDMLKNGEQYYVLVISTGCFHFSKDSITVFKENDDYFVSCNGVEKKLTAFEIDIIRRFEMELVNMSYGECTTLDMYFISYNESWVVIGDGSCRWHGAYYLKKDLGLIKEVNTD